MMILMILHPSGIVELRGNHTTDRPNFSGVVVLLPHRSVWWGRGERTHTGGKLVALVNRRAKDEDASSSSIQLMAPDLFYYRFIEERKDPLL